MKKIKSRFISAVLIMIITVCSLPVSASAASAESKAGIISVTSGSLYIRKSASTSSAVLTKLPKGSYVSLISKSGSWWYVEYGKNLFGYCWASYIKQVSGAYAAYASCSLNIRSGPGISYGVISWLGSGNYAVVLSSSGNWLKILYSGTKIGYVSGSYMKTGSGYSTISLSVPSYKQTDSRWAYTEVGTSGKTINSIGCSTVALAMSESYRTGSTIYPDAMAFSLKYTSGGAVYWPSNYIAYAGSDYLRVVYSQLKSGEPVLVGLKTSSGGQHWVVVTGFSGGALSASNFTVNDPGSSSRTTLQMVINAYPYFYKIMYY
ncbi:MAG: SH3 domain-containing protein [Oscillospiraceae bacterium]